MIGCSGFAFGSRLCINGPRSPARITLSKAWCVAASARAYSATARRPQTPSSPPGKIAIGGLLSLSLGIALGAIITGSPGSENIQVTPVKYADKHGMLKAARQIEALLPPGSLSYDEDDIEEHGASDWSSINSRGRAVAIAYPTSTEQVSQIAAICNEHRTPLVPYGAGSSIEGNFASPYSGIVLDFTFMDKIIAFHPDDMDVVVQPGVNWVELNKTTAADGLFLPLDPSPTATVGGMVSTNCSGTNAFRYGTMKDWVVNLTVVLADGRVIKTRRRPRKTSAGYNLTSLFVGAEGTLGIVTELTLKLAVMPLETSVAAITFDSISDATSAATRMIRSGVQLAALELMDDVQMGIVAKHGTEHVRKMNWAEKSALFVKFAGPTKEGVQADIKRCQELLQDFRPERFALAKSKEEESSLWAARKEALWTMTSIKPEGHAIWSTDVAVPISRLAELINLSKLDGEKLGVFTSIVGHVGDGNFHEALMYDPTNSRDREAVETAIHTMMHRALEMEGTVSGEHAIGMGKMDCLVDELGLDTVLVMRQLKHALDPRWILNPGKVLAMPEGSKVIAAQEQRGF
ncbi:FAD binding domain-containing protein [Sarocladium implicatum]|nr:FAD binding domain-containing protein [Sarocladium implicatum]